MENETEAKILQLLDVISVAVAAQRNDMAGLRGEFGELGGEFGELRGEFGQLRGEVGQLRDEVGQLRTEVGHVRTGMRAGFDRVDRRCGNIEMRIEPLGR